MIQIQMKLRKHSLEVAKENKDVEQDDPTRKPSSSLSRIWRFYS